jgi:hypothetical protein
VLQCPAHPLQHIRAQHEPDPKAIPKPYPAACSQVQTLDAAPSHLHTNLQRQVMVVENEDINLPSELATIKLLCPRAWCASTRYKVLFCGLDTCHALTAVKLLGHCVGDHPVFCGIH